MRNNRIPISLVLISFLLSSCKVSPTSTPQLTPTSTSPIEPLSSKTPRAQASIMVLTGTPVSLTPTEIPTLQNPTSTSTTIPVTVAPVPQALNPSGPYAIIKARNGIWIANPDGRFLTQLSNLEAQNDLYSAISPAGDHIALIVNNDDGLVLVLVTIPGGVMKVVAQLISLTPEERADATSAKSIASYAISDYNSLAWQPAEGHLLAFIGAMNGPTADLYLYDTQTNEITQLTDGPSQAVLPTWSPDGQYIQHFGVSWVPPFGGAIGNANRLAGLWVVRASDGEVIDLSKPKGPAPHFVGWQDDTHFITLDSDEECYSQNLRLIDIMTGETEPVMEYSFYYQVARSPENGAFLFSSAEGCANSLGDGVFLLPPLQSDPIKLLERRVYEIDWLQESEVFDAYPEALFSSDGTTRYDPPVYNASFHPALSKAGYQAWEVIENQRGHMVVNSTGKEWQTVMFGLVVQLLWDPLEGKDLLIAMEDGSFYTASFPEFRPKLMGEVGDRVYQVTWSP